jgi:hypothetical protein
MRTPAPVIPKSFLLLLVLPTTAALVMESLLLTAYLRVSGEVIYRPRPLHLKPCNFAMFTVLSFASPYPHAAYG